MSDHIIYSKEPEDFHYMGVNVPCQKACPATTNIPAYIRALYEESYEESYYINRAANILPGVLGRICSRPCETMCRHGEPELGQPVNICHIKRAAADFMKNKAYPEPKSGSGKKVAIIGAGPSGLAAAHDLALYGFEPVIYEAMENPGGMLMYGIPEFRLPRDLLEREIESIIALGTTLKTGISVGRDITVDKLLEEYDAVLASTGCYRSISLDIPGENLKGVYPGLEFMMKVCAGEKPEVGDRVLVIGAGFTAFDCARSALRLGAKDVKICLRRTEEDLKVTQDEILETKKEGVKIQSLMISRKILGQDHVQGLEFVRTQPGEKREDGKRRITPVEGSEFILDTDSVIVATGQMPGPFESPGDKDKNGVLIELKEPFLTSVPGLYIAGDYAKGPTTVIEAIAQGRMAANIMATDLTGQSLHEKVVRFEDTEITDRDHAWDFIHRQEMPTLTPVESRIKEPTREVETGYSRDMAHEESKRCYLCYLHYEIDMDRCIYCRYCIDVAPRDCIKLVDEVIINDVGAITGFVETTDWEAVNAVIIDNSRCIRCGECVRVCPMDCISVTRAELIERNT